MGVPETGPARLVLPGISRHYLRHFRSRSYFGDLSTFGVFGRHANEADDILAISAPLGLGGVEDASRGGGGRNGRNSRGRSRPTNTNNDAVSSSAGKQVHACIHSYIHT